jgi:hypothetical protein
MITLAKPEPISVRVREKLGEIHRTRRSRRLLFAILWTVAIGLLAASVAMVIDGKIGWWSMPMRVLMSASFAVSTLATFAWGMRRFLSPRHDEELARVGDDHTPILQERLQTLMLSTSDARVRSGVDRIMLDQVALETEGLMQHVSPQSAAAGGAWTGGRSVGQSLVRGWIRCGHIGRPIDRTHRQHHSQPNRRHSR